MGQLASRLVPRTSASTVGMVFILCAIPPATNVSPGMGGYAFALVVLSVTTLWLLDGRAFRSPLWRWESWAVVALFAWVAFGVLRAGGLWDTALVATGLAGLAIACPWALARRVSRQDFFATIVLMCGAAVIGSAVAAWVIPIVLGHGLGLRPGLPIGGASNNAVGLTLALAGTLVGARLWPNRRWLWRGLALVAAVLVLQSVSRAAWVMVLVVLLGSALIHRRWDPRKVSVVGAVVTMVTLGALVALRGRDALIDPARWDNAARGLEAWSSSPGSVLFGLGPMQLWPWLGLERAGAPGSLQHESLWGAVLYHAHSTYLYLLVEHGIIGFVALLVVLGFVIRRCVREIRQHGDLALVAVAVLLALPAMLVELYLFRGFPTAVLWWSAVLAVGHQGADDEAGRTHADEGAARSDDRHRPRDIQAGREDLYGEPEESHRREGPGQVEHLAR